MNDLGIQNFSNTFISQNRPRARKYLRYIGTLKLLASLVFVAVVFLISILLGYLEYWTSYLGWLVFNQILVTFIFYFRAQVAGMGFYRWDSIISVLDKTFMILICGVLILKSDEWGFSIYHFIYAQTASLLITLLLLLLVSSRLVGRLQFAWHWPTIRVLLRKSAPFALTFMLTVLYTRVDSVMLERMLNNGAYESGVYVSGFRLLEASNMLIYLFIGLLLPMLSYLHKKKEEAMALFWMGFKIIFVISVVAGILFSSYSIPIMELLYTNANDYWAEVMSLLMFGFIGMAIAHIAGAALLANHLVRKCNFIYAIGMVINIVLNLILIPENAALGAATATLVTQFFVAGASMALIVGQLKFNLSWSLILRLVVFVIIVAGISYWRRLFDLFPVWYVELLFLGLIFALFAMMTGLLPLNQLIGKRIESD